jgi:hypothetical protein
LLQTAQSKAAHARDERLLELVELSKSVADLVMSVYSISEMAMREMESERAEAANWRDQVQMNSQGINRMARALKLKQADLDSKFKHQKAERESVQRLLKQIDEARREWEASTDGSSMTNQQLQKELELLRGDLAAGTAEDLGFSIDECAALMNSVGEALREEVCALDMAGRFANTRLRNPGTRPAPTRVEAQPIHGLLQAARDRIQSHRRERERSVKEVKWSLETLNENRSLTDVQ